MVTPGRGTRRRMLQRSTPANMTEISVIARRTRATFAAA
jgi:hypothetical protein